MLAAALLVPSFLVLISATVGASGSWQGEYWNLDEGEYIAGEIPGRTADFSRADENIDFDWGSASPDDSISDDYFAARWTKTMAFDASTSYNFETYYDDRIRISVDGDVVYDDWGAETSSNSVIYNNTSAGSKNVVVEFREDSGEARAGVSIVKLTQPPAATQLIGQDDFTSSMENTITPTNYGFDTPSGLAVDTVNHRLFVSDNSSLVNRILVFNLSESNELVDKTADYVIGLSSMTVRDSNDCDLANANVLCEPAGLTVDEVNNRLFVADTDNHRVLVYNLNSLANGMAASYVLGQNNFEEEYCNGDDTADDDVLCYPADVDYDSTNDRLFVADEDNSRVLAFDVAPNEIQNGMSATGLLGQADFNDRYENRDDSAGANTLRYPRGVHFDEGSSRLLVADEGNSRVLIYNLNDGFTNGEDAQTVLGQADFGDDCDNRCGEPGQATQNSLDDPSGVHYDPNLDMIFIADGDNDRVVVYDDNGDGLGDISNGADFDYVLGQADFTGTLGNRGGGVAANSLDAPNALLTIPGTNRLFVSDEENSRVLVHDVQSITNGEDAVDVLGQSNLVQGREFGVGRISPRGLSDPADVVVDSDNNRVFVADEQNARVAIYNTNDEGELLDANADNVLGQPDLYTRFSNGSEDCPEATQSNMCTPTALAYDAQNNRLFVSDRQYNRITSYDVTPGSLESGAEALNVLGQPDFTSSDSNQGGSVARNSLSEPLGLTYDDSNNLLYVADRYNHRVLAYTAGVNEIENGMNADRVLGQADFTGGDCNRNDATTDNTLCYPSDIAVTEDGQKIYITDNSNSRVVIHDGGNSFENGQSANGLIGQDDFSGNSCDRGDGTGPDTLCGPKGIAIDENNNYLYIADYDNHRVVRYGLVDDFDGTQSLDTVYGQTLATRDYCNFDEDDPSEYSLCNPEGIAVNTESGQLWVADSDNNRVLGYGEVDSQPDTDNDGISNEVENAGPNGGDANNDGTPDSEQAYVASMVSPVSGKYAVLEVNDDCTIQSLEVVSEGDVSNVSDSGYNYPAGLMDFRMDCGTPGYTATVQQYYYGVTGEFTVRKYIPANGAYTNIPGATTQDTTIAGQAVKIGSYQLTDGSAYDLDNETNGSIEDPAGLAQSAVGSPNTGLGRL
jgi:DNA-binding beta-propeller fold protein YncE